MKPFFRAVPVLLCLAFGASVPALAQKTYAIAFGGGAAIPVAKFGDTQKDGYNALASLAIGVADLPLGLRLDGIYNNLKGATQTNSTGSQVNPDVRVAGVLANLVFAFPATSAKPYIIAGAGYYMTKTDTTNAKTQKTVGFNGGAGATFGFGPFAAFIESRYHSVSRGAAKGVIQFVPITIGVMF
jgi:hypothetical protein